MNYYLNVTDKDYKNIMGREYSSLYNCIEDYKEVVVGESLKGIFDTLWHASGHQMSPSYKDSKYIIKSL